MRPPSCWPASRWPGSPLPWRHEWRNEEFNRLGALLETSTDIEARVAAWRRMLEIYDRDDPPGTVLHEFALFYAKRREVDWRPLPVEWMDFRAGQLAFR